MCDFAKLYELCLRPVQLAKIPSTPSSSKKNGDTTNGQILQSSTFESVFQNNRIVAVYFTNQWSNSNRQFTSNLRRLYDTLNKTSERQKNNYSSPAKFRKFFNGQSKSKSKSPPCDPIFEIIAISVDGDEQSYQKTREDTANWWILPYEQNKIKSRLLRVGKVQSTPALVVIDANNRHIITYDGRRQICDDPSGNYFPWWPAETSSLLSGPLLCREGDSETKRIDFCSLQPCVKALLFAANWCPPCRAFTKQINSVYENVRANGHPFEVIFCSSDRAESSFEQYYSLMPWMALPFADPRITALTRSFNVNGIPALLILDEQNRLITRHGRNAVLADPDGKEFPWYPKILNELNEFTLSSLKSEPSLVLFTEGTPEDVSFSLSLLDPFAKSESHPSSKSADENGNEGTTDSSTCLEPLQYFYTVDDPICDQLLEVLSLGDAALPLLVIMDLLAGIYYVCEQPDVSEEVLSKFIADYRSDNLEPKTMTAANLLGPTQVGGIPVHVINAALGLTPSPSTNQNLMQQSMTNGDNK